MELLPKHPGQVLSQMLAERELTIAEFARTLSVSSARISQILSGKRRITIDSAFRIADVLNTTPDFWLDKQKEYYKKLAKTCTIALYGNPEGKRLYLSHAGGTLGKPEDWEKDSVLWSRDHFDDEWPADKDDDYVIHGHTPVDNFRPSDDENLFDIYIYADGHKINIDTGAKWSGRACLFNLDIMEPIYLTV